MSDEIDPPDEWHDLTKEQQRALVEIAQGRVFWNQFWGRVAWLKGPASVLLTVAAAWTLLGDALAAWLQGKVN